jgi:hypothetical protein
MEDTTQRRWLIPALLSIVLLVFLFVWNQLEHHEFHGFWWDFLRRGLEAGVIAMILALTVDTLLKKEFGRDVFLASIGYLLPKELQPEMRWISQLRVLCTQDVMICELTAIGDSVRFHVHRKQVVKNISHSAYSLPIGLGIDQWFRGEADSQIIRFSYVVGDGRSGLHSGPGKKSQFGMNLPDSFESHVTLEKDQEITISSEFEEIYPRNGYWFMHVKYPTSAARVTVRCPDDLGAFVDFANREGKNALKIGYDYVCPFTLLPYQRTAVRFWDKKQGEERMRT